mgnify:CR=1 FL=1
MADNSYELEKYIERKIPELRLEPKPTLDEIKSIFNDNADLELSKISQTVFSGNPKKVSTLLNKVFDAGIGPITIIRTLINYVQRIETTQIALKKNRDFDIAIKGLRPPVFWKEKDLFKLHCTKWPINETISNFNLLVDAELSCKKVLRVSRAIYDVPSSEYSTELVKEEAIKIAIDQAAELMKIMTQSQISK